MRIVFGCVIVSLLTLAGCNMFPNNKPPTTGPAAADTSWAPTGNDSLDVVAVSLYDFMKQGKVTTLVDPQRKNIVINHRTNGPGFYISEQQLQTELRRPTIPIGALEDLQARNQQPSEVNWLPPGLPFFTSDLDALPVDLVELGKEFPAAYPKAFAGIWLWNPGFSEDGQWALVRFSFAPTPHGAIGTYILVKDDTGKWQVTTRTIHYFTEPR